MLVIRKILLCSLLTALCALLQAQARFVITANPSTIGKDESFEFRLSVENVGRLEQITPPQLRDFTVLAGPSQENGMQDINGNVTRYTAYVYILKPKRKGDISISPARAKADGEILTSNRLTIHVTNNSTAAGGVTSSPFGGSSFFDDPYSERDYQDFILRKGENVQAKIDKNIFIRVEADKTSCYVGEPLVVTYKLYTRLKSETNIIKNPSFNGFSVVDLTQPGNSAYRPEKYNGRDYNVYTLRKSQLYPLQAGPVELESAEVENTIHFVKEEAIHHRSDVMEDLLRDFGQAAIAPEGLQDEHVTLKSKPVTIEVKPLPEAGKPVSFKGATGKFSIGAIIDKKNFSTDDPTSLKIMITGEGNMTLVNAPDINWPAGIESFEPKSYESLNKQDVPVSGSKFFEYPFAVTAPGDYTFEPISFSYFDPKLNKYNTISTEPIHIHVSKGTGKAKVFKGVSPENPGGGQFFEYLFTNRQWIIIPLIVLIITGLTFWLRRDKRMQVSEQEAASLQTAKKEAPVTLSKQVEQDPFPAAAARLAAGDANGFYTALNIEFRNFLAQKLNVPFASLDKRSIVQEADRKGVSLSTCMQIEKLLDEIELRLYTPVGREGQMDESFLKANDLVRQLRTV